MLEATAALASVVRSRAFCAVSVTSVAALNSESVNAAVMSRSVVFTAEPRAMPMSSRLAFWVSVSASRVPVSIGTAIALALVASIATTETAPVLALRRDASTIALVEPVSRLRAWTARLSMPVSFVAATASDAAAMRTPRTATRTVSLTVICAAPALIGAGSEPSSSPSPATVLVVGYSGSGASVAARMRTCSAPLFEAWIAALPAAEISAVASAVGAPVGGVPVAGTPRSTLVTRVTFWFAVSANRLRRLLRTGMSVPSFATRVVVALVRSSAEICTETAGSLPEIVAAPVWTICAPAATVTCVVLVIVVSALLMIPSTASSAGVNTSLRFFSPLTTALIVSAVPDAAFVNVVALGRTSPIAFTSTVARVLAASLTVPPFTAPLAPTTIVELLVRVGVTRLSCEVSVEVSVMLSTTSVVSAAAPVLASILPARVIPARPSAVTVRVWVSAGAVSATVTLLVTAIATPTPLMTASLFTVTPIRALASAERP
ncbi:hypothetical protein HPGCJGGD_2577 [Methylobacterium haplocladii]|nr:hypothetical protein HPGCJGGD_2577 [Methylobacterium haplocladii]